MNKQREVIYKERDKILAGDDLRDTVLGMVTKELGQIAAAYATSNYSEEWDLENMARAIATVLPVNIAHSDLAAQSRAALPGYLAEVAEDTYERMAEKWNAQAVTDGEPFGAAYGQSLVGMATKQPGDLLPQAERMLILSVIDRLWVEHLTILDDLREGIGLRAYGQRDPKVEYQNEAYKMFQELTANIQRNVARMFFHLGLAQDAARGRRPIGRAAHSPPPGPTGWRRSAWPCPRGPSCRKSRSAGAVRASATRTATAARSTKRRPWRRRRRRRLPTKSSRTSARRDRGHQSGPPGRGWSGCRREAYLASGSAGTWR